jgi:hypothetical protein
MMRNNGFRNMHVRSQASLTIKVSSFTAACALLALISGLAPARALEQCRFIQAKPEREACYQRQEAELAAKKKPEPKRDKVMESLEEMKREDAALDRQLHGICRGC